ncbi:MAG: DUF983 domain-containing protein [Pseudomonadota bacterium]
MATSTLAAGLRCRCPECGEGRLFASRWSLDLKPQCDLCGLDFRFADSGDGPAVFAIMILGALMLGGALIVEFVFEPPVWLLLTIWSPLTLGLAFGLLKPLKSLLIAMQYRHKAAEGRLAGK